MVEKSKNRGIYKNMKKNAHLLIIILLISTLSTLAITVQSANARTATYDTHSYAYANPNPAGVNQQVIITFRMDMVLPSATIRDNLATGFMIKITAPDGTVETKGPLTADSTSGSWFFFTPTKLGTYQIQTTFPGQWDNKTGGVDRWYKPSTSEVYNLIVREQPPEPYPGVPLPNDYWTRPINAESKGWWQISGNWLQIRYDYGTLARVTSAFAPYTSGPDSAHILWAKPIWPGGIVGGEFGDKVYYHGLVYEEPYEPLIQAGRIIYVYHDQTSTATYGTYCIDLHTGEQIWYLDGVRINFAQDLDIETANEHGIIPYLWSTSGSETNGTWKMYDAWTGKEKLTVTNVTGRYVKMGPSGELLVYTLDTVKDRLILWNSSRAIGGPRFDTWSPAPGIIVDGRRGIEWNVSIPDFPAATGSGAGIATINEGYILGVFPDTSYTTMDHYVFTHVAFPALLEKDSTGNYPTSINYLWIANRTDIYRAYLPAYYNINDKMYADYAEDTHVLHCYSIETGRELWATEHANGTLWTNFMYNKIVAYDKVFMTGFDGHVRAYNAADGTLVWDYYFGDSGQENPYGSYPVHNGWTIADHKIYVSSDEHSPDSVMWRGSKLWCIDTETGELLWKTIGWLRIPVVADGILTACSGYDNQIYTFGIGPSKTTVSAPQTEIELGKKILITGTVTDQTPGPYCKTKDTAAISDQDMGVWMDHIYMQKPLPTDVTGVNVRVDVIDSTGNTETIGTATSSVNGFYSLDWTPKTTGKYCIVATFEGTKSYGPSTAETAIIVGNPDSQPQPTATPSMTAAPTVTVAPTGTIAPSPTVAPTPGTGLSTETLLIAGAAVVIIIAVIAAALVLRKRK